MIHVRRAGALDTGAMADLLNAIIAKGGTTAMTKPVTRGDLLAWMKFHAGRNAWFVAEDADGTLLGFQWVEPKEGLPPEACDIATFTRIGHTRLGTGTALFDATRQAAKDLGYAWINATIRAENEGGLAYYQSRSFETYRKPGTDPDRITKRYNLR
ncbi:MAG: GNAT family N-acetyltransferase [Pseudomonadota bacterium]